MNTDAKSPSAHGQPAAPTVTPPVHYTDGFGIASIIMAAMFWSIPGLILGIIGESKAKSRQASPVLSRIGWIVNLIMLVFGLIIAAAFFAFLVQNSDEIKHELESHAAPESMQQTFYAASFTVEAPDNFSITDEDSPAAELSIEDETNIISLLAYSDAVSDIAGGTTLAQYADASYKTFTKTTDISEQKREQLAPGVIANPDNLEVIDYSVEGNDGIAKYVYYDRYIKTANGYYMLTTRTMPSRLDTNLSTMKSILASFKESKMTSR
jgi:hypothetical protein